MEQLYNKLYNLYVEELLNLNIGYSFNTDRLSIMNELINAIYNINNSSYSRTDILKLIEFYANL